MDKESFYTFYKAQPSKFGEVAFQHFWARNYQQCYDILNSVISKVNLCMLEHLLYNHCHFVLHGHHPDFSFPRPPSAEEIQLLFNYEDLVEKELKENMFPDQRLLSQPQFLSKALLASWYGIKYKCSHATETGTFLGSTSYLFSGVFDIVNTIEADETLYGSSQFWLSNATTNVKIHHGNSGEILESLIDYSLPTLFFLDAHHSTGPTSNQFGETPLINELKIIFRKKNDFVVVIDDIRFVGTQGWPTFAEIFELVPSARSVTVKYDQIIITT